MSFWAKGSPGTLFGCFPPWGCGGASTGRGNRQGRVPKPGGPGERVLCDEVIREVFPSSTATASPHFTKHINHVGKFSTSEND